MSFPSFRLKHPRRLAASYILSAAVILAMGSSGAQALPVIPGAAGYGMDTPAGRGGKVYRVTNLNASGAGSLKECIDGTTARVCIFEVSGTIRLTSDLIIRNNRITIAGQTAPSPGIMLRGAALRIHANDVLVQHLRVRPGDDANGPDPGQPRCAQDRGQPGQAGARTSSSTIARSAGRSTKWRASGDRTTTSPSPTTSSPKPLHDSIHPEHHRPGPHEARLWRVAGLDRQRRTHHHDRQSPGAPGGTQSAVARARAGVRQQPDLRPRRPWITTARARPAASPRARWWATSSSRDPATSGRPSLSICAPRAPSRWGQAAACTSTTTTLRIRGSSITQLVAYTGGSAVSGLLQTVDHAGVEHRFDGAQDRQQRACTTACSATWARARPTATASTAPSSTTSRTATAASSTASRRTAPPVATAMRAAGRGTRSTRASSRCRSNPNNVRVKRLHQPRELAARRWTRRCRVRPRSQAPAAPATAVVR